MNEPPLPACDTNGCTTGFLYGANILGKACVTSTGAQSKHYCCPRGQTNFSGVCETSIPKVGGYCTSSKSVVTGSTGGCYFSCKYTCVKPRFSWSGTYAAGNCLAVVDYTGVLPLPKTSAQCIADCGKKDANGNYVYEDAAKLKLIIDTSRPGCSP